MIHPVIDTYPSFGGVRPELRVPGLGGVGGRGLVLVDKLSRTCGTASLLSGGKVVWAVLTVPSWTQASTRSG